MLNLQSVSGAVVVMAGSGQDQSRSATSPDPQSVVRTAGAKTPAGITIELEALVLEADGVVQPFESWAGSQDFALAVRDRTGRLPRRGPPRTSAPAITAFRRS